MKRGGRFLKKDKKTGVWKDIGDGGKSGAVEKAARLLRETSGTGNISNKPTLAGQADRDDTRLAKRRSDGSANSGLFSSARNIFRTLSGRTVVESNRHRNSGSSYGNSYRNSGSSYGAPTVSHRGSYNSAMSYNNQRSYRGSNASNFSASSFALPNFDPRTSGGSFAPSDVHVQSRGSYSSQQSSGSHVQASRHNSYNSSNITPLPPMVEHHHPSQPTRQQNLSSAYANNSAQVDSGILREATAPFLSKEDNNPHYNGRNSTKTVDKMGFRDQFRRDMMLSRQSTQHSQRSIRELVMLSARKLVAHVDWNSVRRYVLLLELLVLNFTFIHTFF